MSKKAKHKLDSLRQFIFYILAHEPFELGLVPDESGFILIKELLQALHEEDQWRYVRQSHIKELLLDANSHSIFEVRYNLIRATERYWAVDFTNSLPFPSKIMFSPIRKKAHSHVLERGLTAPEGRYIVLTHDKAMAERIGKRKDQNPVLIQVKIEAARQKGIPIFSLGHLFLARQIPQEFIAGPALKKSELKKVLEKKEKIKEKIVEERSAFEAGTFLLDQARDPDIFRRSKGKKRKGWKEQARKMRRRKRGI